MSIRRVEMTIKQIEKAWEKLPKNTRVVVHNYDWGTLDEITDTNYDQERKTVTLDS